MASSNGVAHAEASGGSPFPKQEDNKNSATNPRGSLEAVERTNGHANGTNGDGNGHAPAHPAFDSIPDVIKAFSMLIFHVFFPSCPYTMNLPPICCYALSTSATPMDTNPPQKMTKW